MVAKYERTGETPVIVWMIKWTNWWNPGHCVDDKMNELEKLQSMLWMLNWKTDETLGIVVDAKNERTGETLVIVWM